MAGAFHKASVLHCDTSSSNVMLTETGNDGISQTAVLNDWDRAKRVGAISIEWNPRTVSAPALFSTVTIYISFCRLPGSSPL